MPKSHDDPDAVDPIDYARMAREAKERARVAAEKASRRSHPAWEPEPPPIPSSYPAAVPGVGSPSAYRHRASSQTGFGIGVAHIANASGHIGKRVAVLIGAWGSVSWMAAVALTYWTSHSVVSLDRYAKDEAARTVEQNARNRDVDTMRESINELREALAAHQAALNVMQQMPIQTEKKPKKRK